MSIGPCFGDRTVLEHSFGSTSTLEYGATRDHTFLSSILSYCVLEQVPSSVVPTYFASPLHARPSFPARSFNFAWVGGGALRTKLEVSDTWERRQEVKMRRP
jgi:hypothetical protein